MTSRMQKMDEFLDDLGPIVDGDRETIARHADLIPAGSFTELTSRSSQVARLLAGYIVYLDRQITDREAPPPWPDHQSEAQGP